MRPLTRFVGAFGVLATSAIAKPPVILQGVGAPPAALGAAVAAVGDVNKDGFDDIIVGAPNEGVTGHARVFSGKDATVLFAPTPAPGSGDLGFSVSGCGDVDGDGTPDFVVGDHEFDTGLLVNAGAFWVYSGFDGHVIFQAIGTFAGGNLGWCVRGGGDLDGDGRPDVLAGEPGRPGGGAAHAYSATGTHLFTLLPSGVTTNPSAKFGFAVAAVGDLTADGRSDFLVGDPEAVVGGIAAGAAYLVAAPSIVSPPSFTVLWTQGGLAGGARFGAALTGCGAVNGTAGDLNGDGVPDFVVGAPGNNGAVQAFSGLPPHASLFFLDSASALGTLNVIEYGVAVAGAGDVNADGFPDIIIGARLFDAAMPPGVDHGLCQVVRHDHGSLFVVDGIEAGEHYGSAVASAGDVNRDGHADVIIGAPEANGGGGRFEVLSGCPNSAMAYGTGCPGSNGKTPTLALYGCASPSTIGEIWIEKGLPNASALLFLGLGPAATPLKGGCKLLVAPLLPVIPVLPLGPKGNVHASFVFPSPLSPFTVTMQAFVADPGLGYGFNDSNAVTASYP